MAALDLYHNTVKNALMTDGWTITEDPLRLSYGGEDVYVDFGAEKIIAAEKNDKKIAVEIKSFLGHSEVKDLHDALGQYIMYRDIMLANAMERKLYLAVSEATFKSVFNPPFGRLFMEQEKMNLIVFDPKTEEIIKWIHP